MRGEPTKTQRMIRSKSVLVLMLAALSADCGLIEEVVEPPPDYYYCFGPGMFSMMRDSYVAPGEVTTIHISDGGCFDAFNAYSYEPWAKVERLPISEAKPFVVTILEADEGVTVTPIGETQSDTFTVRADVSIAAKPWLLSKNNYGITVQVRLKNPRPHSRGWSTVFTVRVRMPEFPASPPVKLPEAELFAPAEGFGSVKVGSGTSRQVFIYNKGTSDVTLAGVGVGNCAAPCPFQITGGLGAGSTIAKGSNGRVTVTFTPAAAGSFSANLTVTASGGGGTSVPMSGTGQ